MEKTKQIFVITHGEKVANMPNPKLTEKGRKQIWKIIDSFLLPSSPSTIICGTGTRHLMTAKVAMLTPTAYSSLCGCPDSSDVTAEGEKIVLLADGTKFPIGKCLLPDTKFFLRSLANNTILIAGRPFMIGLSYNEAKEGEVIKITVTYDEFMEKIDIKTIFSSDGKKDIH